MTYPRIKNADDIDPGDIVYVLGQAHRIVEVKPYDGPIDCVIGIAVAADGWSISLLTPGTMEVVG